jgi:branched-subunit amino acid transport protein
MTYIPRALPAVLLNYIRINKNAEKYLTTIPYAALGALIFPGILTVNSTQPLVGILGGIVALLLSFKKCKMAYIIIGSVLAVILIDLF